jgi:ubiquinone/menaquinone biosynthesis C-methylase UbiE
MDIQTEMIKRRYNRIAQFYDQLEAMMEKKQIEEWRGLIWRQARGKVLEVGVGTGKNIPYYPQNTGITAIDFSEKMLEKAREKAIFYNKTVDLRLMDIQQLEFPDETFDMAITTFVFCSVPDPVKGLHEMKRVLKKGGRIMMMEHVRSEKTWLGLAMDLINPLIVRISGANINRKTFENLRSAGLPVALEQNLVLDIVKYLECRRS